MPTPTNIHSDYGDYYTNNEFRDVDYSALDSDERWRIENYAKGISLTDQATAEFLNALNGIDRPITVIFYGDHLPGIYATADDDNVNTLTLHETDYFIWSNTASDTAGVKLSPETTNFSSSNYLMSTTAEHMNAAVSPYLAMLTELHQQVPALSRVIGQAGGFGEGENTRLDTNGNAIDLDAPSSEAKQLLEDYLMMQYDLTAGNRYLCDTDFLTVPESQHMTLSRGIVPPATPRINSGINNSLNDEKADA